MKKLTRARPEDFDVETLMAAAREGRLYVDECKNEVSREQVKIEVRAYVERIKVFVTKNYSSSVDELFVSSLAQPVCQTLPSTLMLLPQNRERNRVTSKRR